MKLLTIVRHGKSEALDEGGEDRQRQLVPKGRKDLRRLKQLLTRMDPAVDLITASPAQRAEESATLLAESIGYEGRILLEEELYEAAPSTLLQILSDMPEDAGHILVVAHNPGVEGLVSGLCAGSSRHMTVTMSTASLAHLELEIYWWQQIRWGCGVLHALVRPGLLKKKVTRAARLDE